MIKRHSLLALSGVVIVSSRVCWLCWLCWLRPCSLEYLQMWTLLQSLYSVLYKLKLCLLLLDVCAAQCAAATPQDNRRGTWSWTTGLHGSYSGNNRRDASTGETGEAGDGCGQGYVQTPRILHINCILKGLKLMPTAHTTAFL